MVVFSWSLTHYITFNYLSEDKDLLFWARLSYEISAEGEDDHRVVGLSKEEDQAFWIQEDLFCYYWFKLSNYGLIFTCFVSRF